MSRQQSSKSGVRSSAQKEDDARHDYEPRPASNQVAGATAGHKKSGRTVEEVTGVYIDEKTQERAKENSSGEDGEDSK